MRILKTIKQWLKARKANPFEEAQEYLLKPNGSGSGVEDYICFAIRIAYDQGKFHVVRHLLPTRWSIL